METRVIADSPTVDVVLGEHTPRDVILSDDDAALLRREFAGRLDILPTPTAGRYTLQSHQYVGFVVLPNGRAIEIRPKVQIGVLFAMLSKAHHLADFEPDPVSYTSVAGWFEFVVDQFVGMIEELVARGVLRSFESCESDVLALRGKLLLTETVRHRPVVRDRHWCAFTEFTADILENRILKLVCNTLLPYPYKKAPDLGRRLRRLLRVFANVQFDTWASECFEQLVYHRLNEHYRPSLALARLLLSYLSLSGSRGVHQFLAFLVDMNALFEQYVTAILHEAMASRRDWMLAAQDPRTLDLDRQVVVRPDVVLYRRDVPVLALDAKYKLQEHNADIYQALAYCHALGIRRAILVYPASEDIASLRHRIRPDATVEIVLLPFDLAGEIHCLERQTENFVDAVGREALVVGGEEV